MTETKEVLLTELQKLHAIHEIAATAGPDYYEPGMSEYADLYDGIYNEETGEISLTFEARGTRYEERMELIEHISAGEPLKLVPDTGRLNRNNQCPPLNLQNEKGEVVGSLPPELNNALTRCAEKGELDVLSTAVSYVEPLSKRSRHASKPILFVALRAKFKK